MNKLLLLLVAVAACLAAEESYWSPLLSKEALGSLTGEGFDTGLESMKKDLHIGELYCSEEAKQLDILHTALWVNVKEQTATAKISFRSCTQFPVFNANLTIHSIISRHGRELSHLKRDNGRIAIDLGFETSPHRVHGITIRFSFASFRTGGWVLAKNTTGAYGTTSSWPYYCGNIYPCHASLGDSSTYQLKLTNLPAGDMAVYAEKVLFPSPSYLPAFTVGKYKHMKLGRTAFGTDIGAYHLPGAEEVTKNATSYYLKSFEWFEKNLGTYKFGVYYDTIIVKWPEDESGGMEYTPIAHISTDQVSSNRLYTHEAGHAWFGNGVRIRTWNDFVLSEGTNSYISARAIEATGGEEAGRDVWKQFTGSVIWSSKNDTVPVVRRGSGVDKLDILKDEIFSNRPYHKGAWFYRLVGRKYGRDRLLAAISSFYKKHVGTAMGIADMLDHLKENNMDATEEANVWLYGVGIPNFQFKADELDKYLENTGLSFSPEGIAMGNFKSPFSSAENWTDAQQLRLRTHLEVLYKSERNYANICTLVKEKGVVQAFCFTNSKHLSYAEVTGPADEAPVHNKAIAAANKARKEKKAEKKKKTKKAAATKKEKSADAPRVRINYNKDSSEEEAY